MTMSKHKHDWTRHKIDGMTYRITCTVCGKTPYEVLLDRTVVNLKKESK